MGIYSNKQAHIYITQSLQRQGAYKKDKQYPQAIDLALTKSQNSFIRSNIKPKKDNELVFEINQGAVSDLQPLINIKRSLKVFKTSNIEGYCVLPPDFCYLLSDKSIVIENCQKEFTNATESITERIVTIPLNDSKLTSGPFYKKITIKYNNETYDINTLGYDSIEEKVNLVDIIIEKFYSEYKLNVYWEKYNDVNKKMSFVISLPNLTDKVTIEYDNGTYSQSNPIDSQVNVYKDLSAYGNEVLNRNVKSSVLANVLGNSYYTSHPDSPVSVIADNKIWVYGGQKHLVSSINISYIRKPKPVDLSLNQCFEVGDGAHQLICDLAVEILKEQIEDDSLQTKLQLNNLRN